MPRRFSDHGLAAATGAVTLVLVSVLLLVVKTIPSSGTAGAAQIGQRRGSPAPAEPALHVLHGTYHFTDKPAPNTPPFPVINAASGILIDTDTHTILWQRNAHAALAPASTTKIVTALVVLENFLDARPVTVTKPALTQAPDETKLGLQPGQTLTVRDLVYGMLMISANDAATTLAIDTVGMPAFVRAMNDQVVALGLHDSHFVHPVGLDDPGEKSSAYDLAVLGIAAYDNFALFRTVTGTEHFTIPATASHPAFDMYNIDLLLTTYPGVLGIKPGYTGDAGYCLVAMASRGGHRLVSVLMNAPLVYHQSATLLDWGFQTRGVPSAIPTPTPTPTPRK